MTCVHTLILQERPAGGYERRYEWVVNTGTSPEAYRVAIMGGRAFKRAPDRDFDGFAVYAFAPCLGYSTTHIAFKDLPDDHDPTPGGKHTLQGADAPPIRRRAGKGSRQTP